MRVEQVNSVELPKMEVKWIKVIFDSEDWRTPKNMIDFSNYVIERKMFNGHALYRDFSIISFFDALKFPTAIYATIKIWDYMVEKRKSKQSHLELIKPNLFYSACMYERSKMTYWVINQGATAKLIGISDLSETQVILISNASFTMKTVIKNEQFTFICHRRDGLNWNAPSNPVRIKFEFEDTDGRVHEQFMTGIPGTDLTMNEPKLVRKSLSEKLRLYLPLHRIRNKNLSL